jgi:hypothetical protein
MGAKTSKAKHNLKTPIPPLKPRSRRLISAPNQQFHRVRLQLNDKSQNYYTTNDETTEITEKDREHIMKCVFTVVTVDQLKRLIPETLILQEFNSSTCTMREFVKYTIDRPSFKQIEQFKSFADLIEFIKLYPKYMTVELLQCHNSVMYISLPSLDQKYLRTKYTWSFLNKYDVRQEDCSMSCQFLRATHLVPIWSSALIDHNISNKSYALHNPTNILFVIKGARATKKQLGNCYLKEFLKPQYRRAYGDEFKSLNDTQEIIIQDSFTDDDAHDSTNTNLALGIGFSAYNDGMLIGGPAWLRINGICIQFDRLF